MIFEDFRDSLVVGKQGELPAVKVLEEFLHSKYDAVRLLVHLHVFLLHTTEGLGRELN